MKKILALTMACSIAICSAGCGSKPVTPPPGMSAMEMLPENATPVETVTADFQDKVNSGSYKSTEELATALAEADYLPFDGAVMQVEEGWLNGFSEEISGFQEGYMFGPVIGSIPFVGYVFVVNDDVKPMDFMKTLDAAADLGWNICTQADEKSSAAVNETVCFVMAPASFEE